MTAAPTARAGRRSPFGRAALVRTTVALGNAQRRLLTLALRLLGPERAYAVMAHLARRFYQLADGVREDSESRCRLALSNRHTEREIWAISQAAFVHRMWNLVDLMLAPRLLRPSTLARHGGRIPESYRTLLIEAQRRRQPVILLTAYYGSYDLLPVFLGLNGIQATAVYRPHPNRGFDAYRQAVRTGSGCRMLTQSEAAWDLSAALAAGQTVALLADHAGGRSGVPVRFLGQDTTAPRSVGWLAERYGAIVAVTAIQRQAESFRFELVVSDLFGPEEWQGEVDRVAYITRRYCAALERIVVARPEQYLWLHRRDPFDANRAGAGGDRITNLDSQGSGSLASRCSRN
jgi:lauroyl/myristoyl acyltransferase